jgi:hypothetical protein
MYTAKVWRADDSDAENIDLLDGRAGLEQIREAIGGNIEKVAPRHAPDVVFWCDEEFSFKELPVNGRGCVLYGGIVCGTIVVMNKADFLAWDQTFA